MMYTSDQLLPISAIQHFLFCPRQCALIHLERLWNENYFTAQGRVMHERAHGRISESRSLKRTESAVQVVSYEYGIFGECDVIDFFKDGSIDIIEYKRGKPKEDFGTANSDCDKAQLCAQALCIEEMLETHLDEGYLFYGKTKHRHSVLFDNALRTETAAVILRLHELIALRKTPPPVYDKQCESCSFFEDCKPKTFSKKKQVLHYIESVTEKDVSE